jgi:uncharacterized phage protein (TIGR01671 family)
MKREIKFRIWDGIKMETRVMSGFLGAYFVQGIDENDSASMSRYNTKYLDGIHVMQFTGVTDMNGIEIYEGDILEVLSFDSYEEKPISKTLEIYYDEQLCSFQFRNDWEPFNYQFGNDFKIIGNIYDNPELINN